MSKAALSLVTLVVALVLSGCILVPVPGHRTDSGVAPREVYPNITTRADLLEKGHPDLRTPDERFFLYQNIGSREWNLCGAILNASGCNRAGTNHWARWEFIEFDEDGVVKKEIVRDCENKVCGSPQAAFLAVLEKRYSPALATEYRRALEQADALSQAVSDGDVQAIKNLLEAGADANPRDAYGSTALHRAVAQGNAVLVERLLDGGADANARDDQGRTALHIAASQGNAVLVERLLAKGADVNAADKNYETPLLLSQDNVEMIALLRAHGAPADDERRMLLQIAGEWHGDGQSYAGHRVDAKYVFKANGAFVYDWIQTYGSGHVEQPPGTLHANGEKLEYKDAEGLLWTFTLDEDKKGRHILHVQSKEGTWTLKQTR
jgi:hypothetical protein